MAGGCVPLSGASWTNTDKLTIDTNNEAAVCFEQTTASYRLGGISLKIKRGEIYYADLRPVVGSEQDGVRLVLVLQNDVGNQYSPTTIVAAITSRKTKHGLPTHVQIDTDGLRTTSIVLLEQIRTVDKIRLGDYVGKLDESTMERINRALMTSLGVPYKEMVPDEQQERCEQLCLLL